jgi:hypothetical protein
VTLFEYLAAAHTLILTFAVTRVLSGLAEAVSPARRYWVHLSWLALAIFLCLTAFWAFWGYREVEWTFPRFIGLLAGSALLYLFSSILVPTNASAIDSWRDHFFKKRILLFLTGMLFVISGLCSNQLLLGVPPMHSSQFGLYASAVVFLIGLASDNARTHTVLAIWPPVGFAGVVLQFAQPGGLFQ